MNVNRYLNLKRADAANLPQNMKIETLMSNDPIYKVDAASNYSNSPKMKNNLK